jgi:hypothetical protein
MLVELALRRRVALPIEDEGNVDIHIGGETFRLSAPARRVLDYLLRHHDCTFGEIVAGLQPQLAEAVVQGAVDELAKQSLVGISA